MKVVFMGTGKFSCNILKELHTIFEVVLVVSQPDKSVGRYKKVISTDTKKYASSHNIAVFQPVDISKEYQQIIDIDCDLIVSASYGQIIPSILLSHPKYGSLNFHTSLLPKYRGAAPIHRAIQNGETITGVTIMKMTENLDAGDILCSHQVDIENNDTYTTLYAKLTKVARSMVPKLINIKDKTFVSQIDNVATYAKKLKRQEEKINWNMTVNDVHNHIRAFDCEPGTYTVINKKKLKIFPGEITTIYSKKPGIIENISSDGLYVGTLDFQYKITHIQVEGKRKLSIKDFINGNRLLSVNMVFS